MPTEHDFVERILEAFSSLRSRAAFEVIQNQFEAGELTFIVDRYGIRIHLDQIDPEPTSESDTLEEMDM
ncbi:MAG TPA: hypothetical protein VFW71_05390 [Actinomycetota bacterium]|nr:hypothetical protein [Actinomycetota bacterium]